MTSKKVVTIYVSAELHKRVQERAAGEGRSMSTYIARLLERKFKEPPKARVVA